MTITELARESQTSEASITRLCRHPGCKGFTEFKMALAFDIQQATPAPEEGDRDDIATLIDEYALSLRDTGKLVKRADLETAAALIHQAGQLQIVGIAASATVGDYLHYKLMRLGIPAQAFTDIHSASKLYQPESGRCDAGYFKLRFNEGCALCRRAGEKARQ